MHEQPLITANLSRQCYKRVCTHWLAMLRRALRRRLATAITVDDTCALLLVGGGVRLFGHDLQPASDPRVGRVRGRLREIRRGGWGRGDWGRGRCCGGGEAVLERRGAKVVLGGGAQGGAADGAGRVLPEPGVDAGGVECVAASREHAHHVLRRVLLQAHRAPAAQTTRRAHFLSVKKRKLCRIAGLCQRLPNGEENKSLKGTHEISLY
jgi:hypothetical protein